MDFKSNVLGMIGDNDNDDNDDDDDDDDADNDDELKVTASHLSPGWH